MRKTKAASKRVAPCGLWHLGLNAAIQREREQGVRLSLGTLQLGPCGTHCTRRDEGDRIGIARKEV